MPKLYGWPLLRFSLPTAAMFSILCHDHHFPVNPKKKGYTGPLKAVRPAAKLDWSSLECQD